jgi:hypothetical protein
VISCWPNRDPIEEKGGIDLYGIIGTGAVNYTDYLGLRCCELGQTGLLNGFIVDRSFDSLHRLGGVAALNAQPSTVVAATHGYNNASHLETVTSGQNTATYGYAANSLLVENATLMNDGNTRLATAKAYDKLNRIAAINNTPSALYMCFYLTVK